jgi:glutamate synthase domain-containing protein 3
MLSYEVSKPYGEDGLPPDTIVIHAHGSCGQSFGAFCASGLTFDVEGDANDYFGKGLSGGKLVIYPPAQDLHLPRRGEHHGRQRGALRRHPAARPTSAAWRASASPCATAAPQAVVEGVGDHGCEYMTGGTVVVLGKTGRNFAAGMSGGIAYVLDEQGDFGKLRCNTEMVELEQLTDEQEMARVRALVENHRRLTGSPVASHVMRHWDALVQRFVKVMPTDYKKALERPGPGAEAGGGQPGNAQIGKG